MVIIAYTALIAIFLLHMKRLIAIAMLCITILLPSFAGGRSEQATPVTLSKSPEYDAEMVTSRSVTISSTLYSLGNLYAYLDRSFLYDIDDNKMEEELIAAMIDSLGDPYSYYVPADMADTYEENSDGSYIGIGTYLYKMNPSYSDMSDPSTWMVVISSVFPGAPADRAGLRSRDMISAINGESTAPLTAAEASKKLKGEPGKDLVLTVHRGDAVFEVTLRPEKVTTPSTASAMLDGNIGYLAIYAFSLTTADSAEKEIRSLLDSGAEKFIIDLRDNGGGTVETALEVADMFLSDGRLLETRFKDQSGRRAIIRNADSNIIVPEDYPVIVLVNGGTASSGEILTAALKDNGRAKVIGSQTFGKGISQEVRPFADGYIQLTTGHFYTPSGNDIHHVGIAPDVVIEDKEYSEEELEAFYSFMSDDSIKEFADTHEYSKENIISFAEEHIDSGVPEDLLMLLIRNEYLYRMDYSERPVADPGYDEVLRVAIEELSE